MTPDTNTFGPAYDPNLDGRRLNDQMERIRALMEDRVWRTLSEIAALTNAPEASVSAQLRHLRKPLFGGRTVNKQRRGGDKSATWEYHLEPKMVEARP